ncbi:ABC transporter ATP-binding protein [Corynebacterium sp. MC-04]|nr:MULTISPECIES: ABC transporter ATP-binding protein [Corynebacterium]KXB50857.1 ABC transporter, ATP-binding protein [Corynebacterium kroppenstedtii]MBY0795821.1 ABC transporter ATP-binding protein [Corynebacterium parakroppenstedtii]MCF6769374.1 ABC transporter ATP-binding protein [Corynebacterium parakroppenstedtii]MCF6784745.1 ABC transporter ATP-binding protein [Corynebacterium parakroppenstedtii]MCF6786587.1 ABC transporter ATP-binding protein [Corynebacterium parakroppenstedtii]
MALSHATAVGCTWFMTSSRTAIDVHDVTRTFGKTTAVDGVSLSIDAGEVVAILGPNGAGKSTLLDLILGLTQPDTGTISVHGCAPASAVRAGLVGAALQDGGLPSTMTVERMVRTLISVHPQRLSPSAVLRDPALERLRRQKIGKLSGGQRQRLRLALATMSAPRVLILDEPSSGLDVTTRSEMWSTIQSMADDGITVLFATHDLTEAERYAGRVIVLNNGKIVADGTPEQLTSHYPTIIRASLATAGDESVRNSSARGFTPGASEVTVPGATQTGATQPSAAMTADDHIDDRIKACLSANDTYERHGGEVTIHTTRSDQVLLDTLQQKLLVHPTVNRAALDDAFSELTR